MKIQTVNIWMREHDHRYSVCILTAVPNGYFKRTKHTYDTLEETLEKTLNEVRLAKSINTVADPNMQSAD